MIIIYKNRKIEKQFSVLFKEGWKYPAKVSVALEAANVLISVATSFRDIAAYSPFHLELLGGKLKNRKHNTGEWSIQIGARTGYRAILIPCDDAECEILGGDILAKATDIHVVKITEVMNHYE